MSDTKVLATVRKLLERASHPGTPEAEADACRQKADSLMLRHAIDEALLDAARTDDKRLPITRRIHAMDRRSQWWYRLRPVIAEIAKTCRVRVALHPDGDATIVGMLGDVDYFELLWTSVLLGFIGQVDPQWDDSLSVDHNIYRLKYSGLTWQQVHRRVEKANHFVPISTLANAVKRHCAMIGEEYRPQPQNGAAYREAFAEGFTSHLSLRLWDMRKKQEQAIKEGGAGLVLRAVDNRVDEEFYDLFPDLRPISEEERAARRAAFEREEERKAAERQAMLDAMTEKQRQAFLDKEARKQEREAAANERYWAERERKNAASTNAGIRAGRAAARNVNLYDATEVQASKTRGSLG